jgi:hypothetical protein
MRSMINFAGAIGLAVLVGGSVVLPKGAEAQAHPNLPLKCWNCVPFYQNTSICVTGSGGTATGCYQWNDSAGTHCVLQGEGECGLMTQESPETLGTLPFQARQIVIAAGTVPADLGDSVRGSSIWVVTDCSGAVESAYAQSADDRFVPLWL